jgi:hypothetical protein
MAVQRAEMTPELLAPKLEISAKTLRKWLRAEFPRPLMDKYARWVLSQQMVDRAKDRWPKR